MSAHRGDHGRASRRAPSGPVDRRYAGRRRAARPSRWRRLQALRRLPAVPTVAGVAALVIAGGGTVTLGTGAASADLAPSAQVHHHLVGTDAVGYSSRSARELAISRDSERQALADAASAKLQQATEKQAAERNAALKSLGKAAEARASEIAKNQWQLPVAKGVYRLTARFGMAGGLWSSNHTGLDFAAPSGTTISAVANGVITETEYAGSYGNRTIQKLEDGTEIWYCHQTAFGVQPGQTVTAGQAIGSVGSTGNSTGPHLHLEVRPGGGDPVDPFGALVFHGLQP